MTRLTGLVLRVFFVYSPSSIPGINGRQEYNLLLCSQCGLCLRRLLNSATTQYYNCRTTTRLGLIAMKIPSSSGAWPECLSLYCTLWCSAPLPWDPPLLDVTERLSKARTAYTILLCIPRLFVFVCVCVCCAQRVHDGDIHSRSREAST